MTLLDYVFSLGYDEGTKLYQWVDKVLKQNKKDLLEKMEFRARAEKAEETLRGGR